MKKRILKFLERYSNIEDVRVEYNRPQFCLCHYEINFFCSDIDFSVDMFFDIYESEESKQRTFDNLDSEIESRLKIHGLKLERKTK